MARSVSVINERIWVRIGDADSDGKAAFYVINGDWEGTVDFRNRKVWCDRFPDDVSELESIRSAVKGECTPYY